MCPARPRPRRCHHSITAALVARLCPELLRYPLTGPLAPRLQLRMCIRRRRALRPRRGAPLVDTAAGLLLACITTSRTRTGCSRVPRPRDSGQARRDSSLSAAPVSLILIGILPSRGRMARPRVLWPRDPAHARRDASLVIVFPRHNLVTAAPDARPRHIALRSWTRLGIRQAPRSHASRHAHQDTSLVNAAISLTSWPQVTRQAR